MDELERKTRKEEGKECSKIEPWDISYYSRAYKATLGVDEAEIRNYFPLEHTRDSILSIYEKLLNVSFHKQNDATVWHEDVQCYAVFEKENKDAAGKQPTGYFYLDLFPREGKYSHQCVYPLRPSFFPIQIRNKSLYRLINPFKGPLLPPYS